MDHDDLIHITVPGSPDDPRDPREWPEGVVVHYVPELHPDDVTTFGGIRVTTPARTIVDLAEELPRDELRDLVLGTLAMGLCDVDDIRASAGRVEWRPSLPLLHLVLDEIERV